MENSQTSHLKEIIKRTKKPICTFSLWIHAYKHTPNTLNCSYSSFKYQHFYEDFSDTYLQIIFPFTVLDSILSLYYTSYHNLKLMKYLFLALVVFTNLNSPQSEIAGNYFFAITTILIMSLSSFKLYAS